jgi:hypothetical protein
MQQDNDLEFGDEDQEHQDFNNNNSDDDNSLAAFDSARR